MKLSVAAFFSEIEEHIENTPVRQAGPVTTKLCVFGHLGRARLFSTLHCAFHDGEPPNGRSFNVSPARCFGQRAGNGRICGPPRFAQFRGHWAKLDAEPFALPADPRPANPFTEFPVFRCAVGHAGRPVGLCGSCGRHRLGAWRMPDLHAQPSTSQSDPFEFAVLMNDGLYRDDTGDHEALARELLSDEAVPPQFIFDGLHGVTYRHA
jgi:hypothetical protein